MLPAKNDDADITAAGRTYQPGGRWDDVLAGPRHCSNGSSTRANVKLPTPTVADSRKW